MRPVFTYVIATVVALVCWGGTAQAAYVMGAPDVQTHSDTSSSAGGGSVLYLAYDVNVPAPSGGVIVRWAGRFDNAPNPARLRVVRPQPDGKVLMVSSSSPTLGAGIATLSLSTRQPIEAGDTIGVELAAGNGMQTVSPIAAGWGYTSPAPADGSAANPNAPIQTNERLLLQAVVEPDADRDGFGDESQDQCPTNAAAQAACPPSKLEGDLPGITGKSAKMNSKGAVGVPVSCPASSPAPCAGVASLELLGARLSGATGAANKAFSVRPGAASTVSVTLSRKGRRLVLRKKRVTARVLLTTSKGTVTSKLRITAAKAKKKRR